MSVLFRVVTATRLTYRQVQALPWSRDLSSRSPSMPTPPRMNLATTDLKKRLNPWAQSDRVSGVSEIDQS